MFMLSVTYGLSVTQSVYSGFIGVWDISYIVCVIRIHYCLGYQLNSLNNQDSLVSGLSDT